MDSGQTASARAHDELHFLLRGERPEDAAREEAEAGKLRLGRIFRAREPHDGRGGSGRKPRRIVEPRLDGGGGTDGSAEAAVHAQSRIGHAPAKGAGGTDVLAGAARRLQISLDALRRQQADLLQYDAPPLSDP